MSYADGIYDNEMVLTVTQATSTLRWLLQFLLHFVCPLTADGSLDGSSAPHRVVL